MSNQELGVKKISVFRIALLAIALAAASCKDSNTDQVAHENSIRNALKECAAQGQNIDYSPRIKYVKCENGSVDFKMGD